MTLEHSQGLQTYIENVDPEQGYIQAKFERCHFNNLRETREGEPVGTQEKEEEDKGGDDGESKYRRFSIFNVFSS